MRFLFRHVTLAAGAAFGVACDESGGAGIEYPLANVTVYMQDNYFAAPSVTIPVGGTVLWIYAGSNQHDAIFQPASAPADCALSRVGYCLRHFPSAGSFAYHCTPHRAQGMTGVVHVNP